MCTGPIDDAGCFKLPAPYLGPLLTPPTNLVGVLCCMLRLVGSPVRYCPLISRDRCILAGTLVLPLTSPSGIGCERGAPNGVRRDHKTHADGSSDSNASDAERGMAEQRANTKGRGS